MVPNTAVTKFKIVVDQASGGIQSVALEGNLYCSAHLEDGNASGMTHPFKWSNTRSIYYLIE